MNVNLATDHLDLDAVRAPLCLRGPLQHGRSWMAYWTELRAKESYRLFAALSCGFGLVPNVGPTKRLLTLGKFGEIAPRTRKIEKPALRRAKAGRRGHFHAVDRVLATLSGAEHCSPDSWSEP